LRNLVTGIAMRLIHTADWHLGRRLKGVDRTPEIANALQQLLREAKNLEVDAVLIAGDIFDVPNPPAYAEKVAYEFFCGLEAAGIPAVAIAGNHDSASRIDGVATLLSLAGVRALGKPRLAEDGGALILNTKSGKLCVGALPFAPERRLLDAEARWHRDGAIFGNTYREIVAGLLENLSGFFRDDTANVIMAHLAIDGATLAKSEVAYYTRDTYALSDQTLPAAANYIALGHIHIHQRISAATPAFYSGSLIQIDFGEAEQEKGFCLVTVEPGQPATVEFKPLICQRPLKVVRCSLENLDNTLEEHRYHPGFLKVVVELESPVLGLADRVREICPQALQIEAVYPEALFQKRHREFNADPHRFDPVSEFSNYYQDRLGFTPNPAVLQEFENLYNTLKEKNLARGKGEYEA